MYVGCGVLLYAPACGGGGGAPRELASRTWTLSFSWLLRLGIWVSAACEGAGSWFGVYDIDRDGSATGLQSSSS